MKLWIIFIFVFSLNSISSEEEPQEIQTEPTFFSISEPTTPKKAKSTKKTPKTKKESVSTPVAATTTAPKTLGPSIEELLEQLTQPPKEESPLLHNAQTFLSVIDVETQQPLEFRWTPYFNFHPLDQLSDQSHQVLISDTLNSNSNIIPGEIHIPHQDFNYSVHLDVPLMAHENWEKLETKLNIPVFPTALFDKINCDEGKIILETNMKAFGIQEIQFFQEDQVIEPKLMRFWQPPGANSQVHLFCGLPTGLIKMRYLFTKENAASWDKTFIIPEDGVRYEYGVFNAGFTNPYNVVVEYPLATEMIPILEEKEQQSWNIYEGSGSFDIITPFVHFSTPVILYGHTPSWKIGNEFPIVVTPRSKALDILTPSMDYLDILMRDRLGIGELDSRCVIQLNLQSPIHHFSFNQEENANINIESFYLDKNGRLFDFNETMDFSQVGEINKIILVGHLGGQRPGIISWKMQKKTAQENIFLSEYGHETCQSLFYFVNQY